MRIRCGKTGILDIVYPMCSRAIGSASSMGIVIGNILPGIAAIDSALEAILTDEPTLLAIHETHRGHLSNTGHLVPALSPIACIVHRTGVLVDCPGMLRVNDIQARRVVWKEVSVPGVVFQNVFQDWPPL